MIFHLNWFQRTQISCMSPWLPSSKLCTRVSGGGTVFSRTGREEQLSPAQSTRTILPDICRCWPQSLIGYCLFYKGKRRNCSNTRSLGFMEQHIYRCYLAEHLERNTDNCAKMKVSLHLPGMKTESCKMESFPSYPNKTSKGSWEEKSHKHLL